jgi:hypothetical protein
MSLGWPSLWGLDPEIPVPGDPLVDGAAQADEGVEHPHAVDRRDPGAPVGGQGTSKSLTVSLSVGELSP